MKKFIQLILIFCLSSSLFGVANIAAQDCASYCTSYPPPYPEDYPCMQTFLANYTFCCTDVFDDYCYNQLIGFCDDGKACTLNQCTVDGCKNLYMPKCPNICNSYYSDMPPPGPNPPIDLEGLIVQVVWVDGYCCQTKWDVICQKRADSIAVSICNDKDPNTIDGCSTELGCTHTPKVSGCNNPVYAKLRLLLEGCYISGTGTMRTDLRDKKLLPTKQPFNNSPWLYTGSEKVESVDAMPTDVVDWVLVELRKPLTKQTVFKRKVGVLRSSGLITDLDNNEAISFSGIDPNTNYYVIVRPRSHVDVMSAMPIYLPNLTPYDFSVGAYQALGYNAGDQAYKLASIDIDTFSVKPSFLPIWGAISGDMSDDGRIVTGDYNNHYLPNASKLNKYLSADVSFDGNVTILDFNIYKKNAGHIGYSAVLY
ncbi:MAG: hypothetical protein IT272_09615 [Chitinophagales bacterium]|jgi:hypothetical protein|nr:hypothetical protein [Sphingobacteriales bacterium]MBP9142800.1 hypothetical protein [Chitinophagales bacterium]MDA0199954.1 hypothetical protein [Bacteroidota bacterium]MBK6890768.1 hypothetical protein [Sphingobacteriales bacterium]MBL0247226.1 hypothetical protein [Sphingobacteriales bacterium]